MKKTVYSMALLACFAAFNANATVISSYDITNAAISSTGGWTHNYSGTITPTSGNLANYSGGSGTLNDGIITDPLTNNQLWYNNENNGDTTITLHLDDIYQITSISLFGADGSSGNSIPGAITSVDVTINSITSTFSTIGFGGSSAGGNPVNDLIDLAGSILDGLSTDTIILSNFQSNWSGNNANNDNVFNIAEIEVAGNLSAVPVPAAVWLFGSGLMGLIGIRRKSAKASV